MESINEYHEREAAEHRQESLRAMHDRQLAELPVPTNAAMLILENRELKGRLSFYDNHEGVAVAFCPCCTGMVRKRYNEEEAQCDQCGARCRRPPLQVADVI